MRSNGLPAAVAALLLMTSACGDDGSTPPENAAPVASFTIPSCTINVPCAFASTSTDDGGVTEWIWDFDGDGNPDADTESASFTYTEAGTFGVALTVRDAEGSSDTETRNITIDPIPPGNTPPTAGFTAVCENATCEFASTSSDEAPGSIAAYLWTFGDGNGSDQAAPSHTYVVTEPAEFTVTLTVTDNEGATDTETQTVNVTPPPTSNSPPTAGFTVTCDDLECSFTSTSADEAPGSIATFAWTFGDGGIAEIANPSHTYSVGGDFSVTLTVTDNEGATDSETQTVSVAPNAPPTAGFTASCTEGTCSFTSTSSDAAPGSIATFAWTFGDNGVSSLENPTHSYAITSPTDFTVTLTVTDDDGATDVETQTVSVTPPPAGSEGCTTVGTRVDCALNITSRSTIKLKLLGISCDLAHERVVIPPPIGDQVFLSVCDRVVGDSTKIFGGPEDEAIIFEAGSQAVIRFVQGDQPVGGPTLAAPSAQLTGTFPNWTINFEDGENPGTPGEPDFSDVVLGVEAVPEP
jgi:PKD repeat protein